MSQTVFQLIVLPSLFVAAESSIYVGVYLIP
jgi:hypothetical protein